MAHPLWTGALVVGALRIPAQILGAGEPDKVAFHHAHRCSAKTLTRVKQKKWCPHCQKEIASASIVRVYEPAEGQYVEVTDTELARCEVQASDELTIVGTADTPRVSMVHIETTAYLVPVSEASAELLATFCAALGPARFAIGELVLQKRTQIIWLGMAGQCCVIYLLRTADHVARFLRADPPRVGTKPEHVADLRHILDRLSSRIDHVLPHDDYQHRVGEMLRRKTTRDSREQLTSALRPRRRRA